MAAAPFLEFLCAAASFLGGALVGTVIGAIILRAAVALTNRVLQKAGPRRGSVPTQAARDIPLPTGSNAPVDVAAPPVVQAPPVVNKPRGLPAAASVAAVSRDAPPIAEPSFLKACGIVPLCSLASLVLMFLVGGIYTQLIDSDPYGSTTPAQFFKFLTSGDIPFIIIVWLLAVVVNAVILMFMLKTTYLRGLMVNLAYQLVYWIILGILYGIYALVMSGMNAGGPPRAW